MKINSMSYRKLTNYEDKAAFCTDLFIRRASVLRRILTVNYSHAPQTFENYDATIRAQQDAVKVCRLFAQRLLYRIIVEKKSDIGLLISGTTGTGKTHIGRAILKEAADCGAPGLYITAADLFERLNDREVNCAENRLTERLAGLAVLVIDEVGVSSWTPSEQKNLLKIFERRIDAGLPTVFLSNLDAEELPRAVGERVFSRALGKSYCMQFDWADYRTKVVPNDMAVEELF